MTWNQFSKAKRGFVPNAQTHYAVLRGVCGSGDYIKIYKNKDQAIEAAHNLSHLSKNHVLSVWSVKDYVYTYQGTKNVIWGYVERHRVIVRPKV